MKFAYADPPYLGYGEKHYGRHHPEALVWDDPKTHRDLINRLSDEWPDGWVLSLHAPSLRTLLPMCPADVRVGAACKGFAQVRPMRVQYAWEPIIWRGGRKAKAPRPDAILRDWIVYGNRPRARTDDGIMGRKPLEFCEWIFDVLGAEAGDILDDLFPGNGSVTAAWHKRISAPPQMAFSPLFAERPGE